MTPDFYLSLRSSAGDCRFLHELFASCLFVLVYGHIRTNMTRKVFLWYDYKEGGEDSDN